jgi:hypothetical protein
MHTPNLLEIGFEVGGGGENHDECPNALEALCGVM